jgi:hypothetical protein
MHIVSSIYRLIKSYKAQLCLLNFKMLPYNINICILWGLSSLTLLNICRNPTLGWVWGWNSHSQKWEVGVLRDSRKLRARVRGQNTSHWGVLYINGKVLKCRCPKWPHMSHLDIYSPGYGQKKGRESNWQFDSRPLKVRNRPLLDVCRRSTTWRWKSFEESYNFGLDLTPIGGWSREIWTPKVPGVQPEIVSGLLLGSPGKKSAIRM